MSAREVIAEALFQTDRYSGIRKDDWQRAHIYVRGVFLEQADRLMEAGYVILSPDEVRGMSPGAAEAFAALDLADRLIESAYGTDTPREWNKAFRSVAKARSMKGGRDAQ